MKTIESINPYEWPVHTNQGEPAALHGEVREKYIAAVEHCVKVRGQPLECYDRMSRSWKPHQKHPDEGWYWGSTEYRVGMAGAEKFLEPGTVLSERQRDGTVKYTRVPPNRICDWDHSA